MIYTVTLNPAIDYVTVIDGAYHEGEVNRTSSEQILAGGKGINVSQVLNNLGVENTAIAITAGFTGEVIERLLVEQGITADFIRLDNGFSRINVKIKADKETEINGRGAVIDEAALSKLYNRLDRLRDGDILVLAGSAGNGMSDSIYADIMHRLSGKNIRIAVDASGRLLTNALKYRPFLIKPNNVELGEILGREIKDEEDAVIGAKRLQKAGAVNVLVSRGGDGAVLVDEYGKIHRAAAPKGTVVNSTGAGDSMVAGFIAGYVKTRDYSEAFVTGIAAGSASAFSKFLATGEQIRELYQGIGK